MNTQGNGSSINDVTQFWRTFDPLPISSRGLLLRPLYCRHDILDPLPIRPWRHLWTTPKVPLSQKIKRLLLWAWRHLRMTPITFVIVRPKIWPDGFWKYNCNLAGVRPDAAHPRPWSSLRDLAVTTEVVETSAFVEIFEKWNKINLNLCFILLALKVTQNRKISWHKCYTPWENMHLNSNASNSTKLNKVIFISKIFQCNLKFTKDFQKVSLLCCFHSDSIRTSSLKREFQLKG